MENIVDYLGEVFKFVDSNRVTCFRGESKKDWKLEPAIMRGYKSQAEQAVISELMTEAPAEFYNDTLMFEKLVRAQHYGLPTRLLDVTMNPLVALYFACHEIEYESESGIVKILSFAKQRVKNFDSDTVSIICNLARLSDGERDEIKEMRRVLSRNLSDDDIKEFRSLPSVERLIHFIKVEKPYFLNKIDPKDLFRYYFAYPAKSNKRVIAQSGAFMVSGLLEYKSPSSSRSLNIKKITIPAGAKPRIIAELDKLNINSRTMYPEIEFASCYIKEKWKKEPEEKCTLSHV